MNDEPTPSPARSILGAIIRFCIDYKVIVIQALVMIAAWGVLVAPFDWKVGELERHPVPVDAIPDIGENQQIVFTEWMGRSPQDVEDQVGYPLTVSLLGISGVKTIRSYSMFGFSTIYVIFKEDVEYYWARSRVLEKLNSLPANTLPDGVQPALGPDATALGQVFWYTLEGRDENGAPTGGWDLDELRSIQDWHVRYALQAADGVAEVASVGGFVREYQVDVDPDAMRANGVSLNDVIQAVRMSNLDVGAKSIEVNQVEYLVRGLGFIDNAGDLEKSVVKVSENVPVYVKDVATVSLGPALRRGALDREGAEAVGGVVTVRFGENPLEAITNVKKKIAEIADGMPEKPVIDFGRVTRAELETFAEERGFEAYDGSTLNREPWVAWLKQAPPGERPDWLRYSKVHVNPFYDRSGLIYETLGTLNTAIFQEILVTIIVVLVMVRHFGSSVLISGLLPVAVLMTFIAMKGFGVDANIVALSGIAIAIGTMIDMGVVICENILRRLDEAGPEADPAAVIFDATREVGGAVLTAVSTTVVSFLPVFAMVGAEGKLFQPLAYTKTFALIASVIVALTLIPPFAHLLFTKKTSSRRVRTWFHLGLAALGIGMCKVSGMVGGILIAVGLWKLLEPRLPPAVRLGVSRCSIWIAVALVAVLLAQNWLPLGPERGLFLNILFVTVIIGGLLLIAYLFMHLYPRLLGWTLDHKPVFLAFPGLLILFGALTWLGFEFLFGWLPGPVKRAAPVSAVAHAFPGLGKEFMPPLDEGSYLFMPTTMPHASIGEAMDVLQKQDIAMSRIPEVESVVGKLGRAESPLDPAPVSMFETVINYRPQFLVDRAGKRLRFSFDPSRPDVFRLEDGTPAPANDGQPYRVRGTFARDEAGRLIPDARGTPFRMWRPALDPGLNPGRRAWPGIRKPDDIWNEIVRVTALPGTTSAPRLQPIAARIVMLQSGMRAPMGVKVKGPDLETIEKAGLQLEHFLKQVPSVNPDSVVADRIVGKPYLEIDINREAIARYGVHIQQIQQVIEVAIGGMRLSTSVEGRERYPIRVRYLRELRDSIEELERIMVPAPGGAQIPLTQLATIDYVRGPQVIKSEDTFLIGYVIFDRQPDRAEVDVVEDCRQFLDAKIASGEFIVPERVSYTFAGNYQNQVRAAKKLAVVLPLALLLIFIILYLQFRSTVTSLLVFTGIFVAWSGGFLMLWLYGQPWFLDVGGLRELFQVNPINLSVAVWVGFLALFGIATDDGVLFATYLNQVFKRRNPESREAIRASVLEGASRRIRPATMTSATTILALLPVLSSTGRGADIMVPMAIPVFGGMLVAGLTVFVVPVLYCWIKEAELTRKERAP